MNDQEGGTKIYDSTSNANHGSKTVDHETTETASGIGKSQAILDVDEGINNPVDAIALSYAATVEYHVKGAMPPGTRYLSHMWSNGCILGVRNTGGVYLYNGSGYEIVGSIVNNDWNNIAWVNEGEGNNLKLYVNGTNVRNDSHTISYGTALNRIYGDYGAGISSWISENSETRISSTARGAGWIKATNLTLRDELVTYGDIQEVVTGIRITTYIPIIGHGSLVSPAAAELELTTYAVEVDTTENWILTPGAAELALTTYPPNAETPVVVTPITRSLILSPYAPDAIVNHIVTPGIVEMELTTYIPVVTATDHQLVTPGIAELVLETFAPTIYQHIIKTPITAELELTTYIPSILVPSRILKILGYTKAAFDIKVYVKPALDIETHTG
jgi:hypothetical protein